jgi:hypothetical protein
MKRIRTHLSYANVMATIAVLFAMTGGAVAATGGFSSGGTLRACANEEGRLKLLKSGERCKRGQKGVSWNQAGPAGAKGVTGSPGAPGSPGAAGQAGSAGAAATNLWARVGADGALLAGSGAVSSGGTGIYAVTFNRDITNCGIVGTLDGGPAEGIYAAHAEEKPAGVVTVATFVPGKLSLGPFTVIVAC